jgi:hypothetical protein
MTAEDYTYQAPPSAPPAPTGDLLVRFDRPGYEGRPDERLDVRLETYHDRPFISICRWRRDYRNQWWPLRGGVSICLKEIDAMMDALQRARRLLRQDARPSLHDRLQRDEAPHLAPERGPARPASGARGSPAHDASERPAPRPYASPPPPPREPVRPFDEGAAQDAQQGPPGTPGEDDGDDILF